MDSYILFRDCPNLAKYYENLLKLAKSESYILNSDRKLKRCYIPAPNVNSVSVLNNKCPVFDADSHQSVYVFPSTSNLCRNSHSKNSMMNYFCNLEVKPKSAFMCSPYLNIPDILLRWLLKHLQQTEMSVLTSSLKGNGFYGSKGIMKLIPHLYLQLSDQFVKSSGKLHLKENKVFKYSKNEHTFHAKYLYLRYSSFWTLFMGSSNFGFSFLFLRIEIFGRIQIIL